MRLLVAGIGGRISAGRDTDGRGGFFNIRVAETNVGRKHEMEYDNDMARVLGADVSRTRPDVSIPAEDIVSLDKKLRHAGVLESERFIVVNPGGMPSRRWPLERFAGVIRQIAPQCKLKFITIGTEQEAYLSDALVTVDTDRVVSVAGQLTVGELWALLSRAVAVITNDTGPMHMAAVVRTPLVAIFGPGDLVRYDPRVIWPNARVLFKGKDRVVCNKYRCGRIDCLKAVSVDEVVREVSEVLAAIGL
jgi:ADP-heptose:LPS heptosyltransferase